MDSAVNRFSHRLAACGNAAPRLATTLLAAVLLCTAGAARAAGSGQDRMRGRELYQNQCTACHESVVHVRERRTVHSLNQLYERVEHWRTVTNTAWSKEEVEAVVNYLNTRYYKF